MTTFESSIADSEIVSETLLEVIDWLGLTSGEAAVALGISSEAMHNISRGRSIPSGQPHDNAILIIRFYRALLKALGGNHRLLKQWMVRQNHNFDKECPIDLIQSTEGLIRMICYIETKASS